MNSCNVTGNSSSSSNHDESYPSGLETFFLFLYTGITLIGIPSNCFSLYVSWQHIRRNNEIGVYLFNLALADIFFTMLLPIWVNYIIMEQWIHGKFACDAGIFLMYTNYYTSAGLLCCIAVDRYLAVVHPLKYLVLRNVKTAACASLTLWLLTIAFNAVTTSLEIHYEKEMCFEIMPLPKEQQKINVIRFLVGFLLPGLLTTYCCWGIHQAVKDNRATEKCERRRVSRLLAVVTLTLWLCFGPIHVMMLLRALLEKDCEVARRLYIPFKVSIALSALNCLADPLLYCFVTEAGKANLARAMFFIKRKGLSSGNSNI
ncbi:psychosine receptor-like [Megalops cyprinoides]|uniref:psychosine receptor-like n=1 Tax=Megalops cyprinoides TaxID=118141 RepID=UPI0018650984|nr:psychosine receptor-like [Megalops cyprinoides]